MMADLSSIGATFLVSIFPCQKIKRFQNSISIMLSANVKLARILFKLSPNILGIFYCQPSTKGEAKKRQIITITTVN